MAGLIGVEVGIKMQSEPRRVSLLALAIAILVLSRGGLSVDAQNELPGVRGTLYESPTFGWILVAPKPDWRVGDAGTDGSHDWVHLVSDAGDGADDYFVSFLDEGRGRTGCVQDLVNTLASAYEDNPLQGWREPEVEFTEIGDPVAYAKVVRSQGPGLDLMAVIQCNQMESDPLLVGEILVKTERDLDAGTIASSPMPYWPEQLHTGRARVGGAPDGATNSGVVLFGALDAPIEAHFPFNCNDQETYTPPAESLPRDRGYFACAGQITNLDVVSATVDLTDLVLGCEQIPAGESLPAGCTSDLTAPVAFDNLQVPSKADGPVLVLEPGEVAKVVLWYALPEGDVPLDIYYLEPGRESLVIAGSTFFTQGTGNRPKVRLSR